MTINTYQFILDYLTSGYNTVKASKLYMEHQLSLPEEFRVCHENEELMEDHLSIIKEQLLKYGHSIKEFQNDRELLLSGKIS